jgi:hypothetical protein
MEKMNFETTTIIKNALKPIGATSDEADGMLDKQIIFD